MMRLLAALLLLTASTLHAATVTATDPESARKAVRDAQPGDVIVLSVGDWKDADLRLDGEGTATAPITTAATATTTTAADHAQP